MDFEDDSTSLSLRLVENVRFIDRFNSSQKIIGTLFLTPTHLIFIDPEGQRETWILRTLISSVEKLPITQQGYPLHIRTKQFFSAEFIISKERHCTELHATLIQQKTESYDELYCFRYQAPDYFGKVWDPFLLETEYIRLGVPNAQWRLDDSNCDFELCDTYPPFMHVPASTTKQLLLASSKFRSRGRLPILSYLHSNGASITRSSQPLVGFSARCIEDEQLLQCILKTNSFSNTMYIIDTRPRINAVANRAAGKGYENEDNYSNIQFKFCPIANIHVMRESLQKLLEVCEMKDPKMNEYLKALNNSSWLQHIKAVLDAAIFIARAIEIEKKNVLVHCSDGWDRTAQCCSLSSLLLCPYYRTIHGFRILIEKEWIAFGHKFSDRCGHLRTNDDKEQSPVFLQFIEAVWQLTQIYPTAFEFNERFLISLHEQTHSCQFGNFIGNCEKDRIDLRIKERTYSYWNYVLLKVNDFRNPIFRPQSTYATQVLLPTIYLQTLKFWSNMYHRFDTGILPKENLSNTLMHLVDHTSALTDHERLLRKRLQALRSALEIELPTSVSNEEMIELPNNPNTSSSFIEHDSSSSEHETNQAATESPEMVLPEQCQSLHSPSDVESGISSDYSSPNKPLLSSSILQNQSSSEMNDIPTLESLAFELNSIALDWRSYHAPLHCSCSLSFDSSQRKYNCWRCGESFCQRCIQQGVRLPGLYSDSLAPVCKSCVRAIKLSPLYHEFSERCKSMFRHKMELKSSTVVINPKQG